MISLIFIPMPWVIRCYIRIIEVPGSSLFPETGYYYLLLLFGPSK
jgi:hypothetical protein